MIAKSHSFSFFHWPLEKTHTLCSDSQESLLQFLPLAIGENAHIVSYENQSTRGEGEREGVHFGAVVAVMFLDLSLIEDVVLVSRNSGEI